VATGAVLRNESFAHSGGIRVLTSPKFADGVALQLVNQSNGRESPTNPESNSSGG